MDASSESSDSNSVNTVVTEIRNQFSRQIKNNQNGTNGTGNAEAHKLLEERAEKVRAAMEKLIRDHQPKISHSANLLTLIKNFETIAKNNEKVSPPQSVFHPRIPAYAQRSVADNRAKFATT